MNRCPRLALVLLLLLIPLAERASADDLPTAKPEAVGVSSEKLAQVSKLMNKQVAGGKLAGATVMVARDGKVIFFEAYGQRDMATGKAMEKDTIVRIYSMTKAIVTTAALMLVEEGKIGLDDPVSQYVPALADVKVWTEKGLVSPQRPMTIADLMRHTAGFGRRGEGPVGQALAEANLSEAKDLDDYAARLAKAPLAYHPGQQWIYSNSIDILGLVIEKASGQPLDEFLNNRLLDPLGMKDTGFYVPEEKRDRFAVSYSRGKEGLQPDDRPQANERYHSKPAVLSGGGGMVGTAGDYMRFLLMIANGGQWNGKRYLKPETVKLMTTDQLPKAAFPIGFGSQVRHGTGFGFGFCVKTTDAEWNKAGRVGEYGWGGAASTHYWVSPNDDGLIVVTVEQVMPFNFDTENLLKPVIYGAIEE